MKRLIFLTWSQASMHSYTLVPGIFPKTVARALKNQWDNRTKIDINIYALNKMIYLYLVF